MRRLRTAPRDWAEAGLAAPDYISIRAAARRAAAVVWHRCGAILLSLVPRPWREAWRQVWRPLGEWMLSYRAGRIAARVFSYFAGTVLVLFVGAPLASAAVGGMAMFADFGLHDFQGFNASGYFVSIDHGGDTEVLKSFTAFVISALFDLYRSIAIIAIWAMVLALSLTWVEWISAPLQTLGTAVSTMTKDLDLVQLMVLIAAVMIVWALITGRFATGVYDLVASAVIAALAAGALSNPVAAVTGKDGLLMSARKIGLSVAVGLAYKGNTGGSVEEAEKDMQKMLVWSMIRLPAQTLSFGRPLDDTKIGLQATPGEQGTCVKEYNEALLNMHKKDWKDYLDIAGDKTIDGATSVLGGALMPGPIRDVQRWGLKKLKDAVTPDEMQNVEPRNKPWKALEDKCGDPQKDSLVNYAKDPGSEQIVGALLLLVGGGILFVFGCYLGMRVIVATIRGIIAAIAAIPKIIIAIAPSWRAGFFRTVAGVVMAMGQIAASVAYLGAYMAVMRQLLQMSGTNNFLQMLLLLNIVLLAGLMGYRKMMAKIEQMAEQLADAMGRKPAAQPVSLKGQKPSVLSAAKTVAGTLAMQKMGAALSGNRGNGGPPALPGGQSAGPNGQQLPPGSGQPGGPGRPGGQAVPGGAQAALPAGGSQPATGQPAPGSPAPVPANPNPAGAQPTPASAARARSANSAAASQGTPQAGIPSATGSAAAATARSSGVIVPGRNVSASAEQAAANAAAAGRNGNGNNNQADVVAAIEKLRNTVHGSTDALNKTVERGHQQVRDTLNGGLHRVDTSIHQSGRSVYAAVGRVDASTQRVFAASEANRRLSQATAQNTNRMMSNSGMATAATVAAAAATASGAMALRNAARTTERGANALNSAARRMPQKK